MILFFTILDVMVLNDIIEQAAGRQSRSSEKAGKSLQPIFLYHRHFCCCCMCNNNNLTLILLLL